jgi:hypothetical protein
MTTIMMMDEEKGKMVIDDDDDNDKEEEEKRRRRKNNQQQQQQSQPEQPEQSNFSSSLSFPSSITRKLRVRVRGKGKKNNNSNKSNNDNNNGNDNNGNGGDMKFESAVEIAYKLSPVVRQYLNAIDRTKVPLGVKSIYNPRLWPIIWTMLYQDKLLEVIDKQQLIFKWNDNSRQANQ